MKLKLLVFSILISIRQSYEQDYGIRYQTVGPGVLSSENSMYLPPETVTPVPYFPMNHIGKLPYPYLPPNPINIPTSFPTPFPSIVISSSFRPSPQKDYDDDESDDIKHSPAPFSFSENKKNRSENHIIPTQRSDRRSLPKTVDYRQPIDRIDVKPEIKQPQQFTVNNRPNGSQKQPQRNVIITPEKRNDQGIDQGIDQTKAGTFPIAQYLPLPTLFISSTTETAVPILRLSNEMDLDGSFSYEALGADQTHYVQHSRIENVGNEKPEQVVEGSYSYVGDNGQTYTVHYIADANGFRASGDHLPVPPPVPEIIQRAVQYNLAEEARKPEHHRNWNEDEDTYQDTEKNIYTILPTHSLFTGRSPESFSFNFLQGGSSHNNLVSASSTQPPIKTFPGSISDHLKSKQSSTISPQITFLASQGAHVPSASTPQPTIARPSPTEKPTMPQLVNYEAAPKEPEQENKNSLRWQYNGNKDNSQTSDKNSISRSFGEDDDVMINFNDMTPEQYTNMIHTEIQTQTPINKLNQMNNKHQLSNLIDIRQKNAENLLTSSTTIETTSMPAEFTYWNNLNNNNGVTYFNYNTQPKAFENTKPYPNNEQQIQARAKIITQQNFIPHSQTVTQSYDYDENSYEIKREIPVSFSDKKIQNTPKPVLLRNIPINQQQSYDSWYNTNKNNEKFYKEKLEVTSESTSTSTSDNKRILEFAIPAGRDDFQPVTVQTEAPQVETTTENFKNNLEENMFLRNIFNSKQKEEKINQPKENNVLNSFSEKKVDKLPKYIPMNTKNLNEINDLNRRPIEVSDILNFISAKNNFESSKLKNNNRPSNNNPNDKTYFNRNFNSYYNEEVDNGSQQSNRENKNTAQQELRGVIKNYKVLQRNNGVFNKERNLDQMYRDLTPSARKENLPPLGRAGPSVKNYLPAVYVK